MARRRRTQYVDGFFHVSTRGNDRQDIYRDGADRYWFLEILNKVVMRYAWLVYAYCLMTTHYHLLVRLPESGMSAGMCELNGRFARWSNWRHERENHVFGKRFASTEITDEAHLLETCRYIVLNPVRAGMVSHPGQWRWSSYGACVGDEEPHAVLALNELLRLFGAKPTEAMRAYRRFVSAGVVLPSQLPVPGTST